MKVTTANKNLEKVAEKMIVKGVDWNGRKYTKNNIKAKKEWSLVMDALLRGERIIRTCRVSGRGRFCKNMDYTSEVAELLKKSNIKFAQGNDAPRGGKDGNYIILTHIEF
jgi:hypothetical protein